MEPSKTRFLFLQVWKTKNLLSIYWLEDKVFVVMYSVFEGLHGYVITQTGTPKSGISTEYLKLEDPCPFSNGERAHNFYTGLIRGMGDINYLMSFGNYSSSEIGLYGCKESEWNCWRIGDGITLPLNSNDDESYPVGLDIDFTSDVKVKGPSLDSPDFCPMPVLFVLTTAGHLLAYNIVDLISGGRETSCSNMSKAEALEGVRKHKEISPKVATPAVALGDGFKPPAVTTVPAAPSGLFGNLVGSAPSLGFEAVKSDPNLAKTSLTFGTGPIKPSSPTPALGFGFKGPADIVAKVPYPGNAKPANTSLTFGAGPSANSSPIVAHGFGFKGPVSSTASEVVGVAKDATPAAPIPFSLQKAGVSASVPSATFGNSPKVRRPTKHF
ncbi:hypothetical protein BDR26DRAFT_290753 [Obelidium mucronatum]|nr:hypothetical protein BDR26DRAFT_290753 [Obelidium mucronatum]